MHARGWHNAERVTNVLARALDARPDVIAKPTKLPGRRSVDAPVAAAAVTAAVIVTAVLRNRCPC